MGLGRGDAVGVGGDCVIPVPTLSMINFGPRVVNLRRPLAPEREKVVWAETLALVGWIKVEVCWMFAYLCLAMVQNGMGLQVGLGTWFSPMTLVVVFGTCAFYLVSIFGMIRGV